MHISWLGQTCVKLQTKNADADVVILIDAYKPKTGDFPRSFTPQIALYSHGEEDAATLSQDPFVISTLGECEVKGVMIYSYYTESGTKIFKINAEGMNIVHLGRMTKKIDGPLLEKLGTPDILFIPVGSEKEYLTAEDAGELVTAIEPRVIIPIGFQCDTEPKVRPVSDFIKETGIKPEATDTKFIIKKKDLPAEDTKMFVLEKNY